MYVYIYIYIYICIGGQAGPLGGLRRLLRLRRPRGAGVTPVS